MKANLKRRFNAYLVDFIIVYIIVTIISKFMNDSNTLIMIKKDISLLFENQINNSNSFMDFTSSYSVLLVRLIKENIIFYYLQFIVLFMYFEILPIILNGKTIGFKLFHIKLVEDKNEKLRFSTLFKRNLVINEYGFFILYISLLYIIPASKYFIVLIILAIIQILVVIISCFMIKYRDDEKSIADILSGSSVIIES